MMTNNRERQENEMSVLSSIYDENEFFCIKGEQIKCSVNVCVKLPKALEVRYTNYDAASVISCDKIFIKHLPPIRFYICLPETYPSQEPPNFSLSVTWLPLWEISFICQKLDDIWRENKDSEIIFPWIDFLQNDFLNFLGIQDFLDVSFMHMIYLTPNDYINSCLEFLFDFRAINSAIFLNPMKLLIAYDKAQHKIYFNKNFYTCTICFEEKIGLKCIKLKNCRHIHCKDCIEKYVHDKINKNTIILCPILNCYHDIDINDIKILSPSLFSQYEKFTLRTALDTMSDIIYCPKTSCQYPIIKDTDDMAIICPTCCYCFCVYCRKIYHGIAPCEMASDDVKQLINDYKNSNHNKKKLLEKKYGKRRIQLIEGYLSTEYLKNNAKSCPNCHSFISKIDGCNKMTCRHCQIYFCWLCGQKITSINAYEHFSKGDNSCFGRLFEGVENINFDIV